ASQPFRRAAGGGRRRAGRASANADGIRYAIRFDNCMRSNSTAPRTLTDTMSSFSACCDFEVPGVWGVDREAGIRRLLLDSVRSELPVGNLTKRFRLANAHVYQGRESP